ncbi:MAG: hypothetical protein JO112_22800 [Planctomycetes bacterium]|nr:hypothetical protein [Planctomycetota bacterium]
MSEELHDPELAALEAALAGLQPLPGKLNRDQLLFRAGQASGRRGWLWPSAAGALALVAAGLAATLVAHPVPPRVERIVYVHVPAQVLPPTPAESSFPRKRTLSPASVADRPPALPGDYLKLRDQVLCWGVDALPQSPAPPPALADSTSLRIPPTGQELTIWRLEQKLQTGDPS